MSSSVYESLPPDRHAITRSPSWIMREVFDRLASQPAQARLQALEGLRRMRRRGHRLDRCVARDRSHGHGWQVDHRALRAVDGYATSRRRQQRSARPPQAGRPAGRLGSVETQMLVPVHGFTFGGAIFCQPPGRTASGRYSRKRHDYDANRSLFLRPARHGIARHRRVARRDVTRMKPRAKPASKPHDAPAAQREVGWQLRQGWRDDVGFHVACRAAEARCHCSGDADGHGRPVHGCDF